MYHVAILISLTVSILCTCFLCACYYVSLIPRPLSHLGTRLLQCNISTVEFTTVTTCVAISSDWLYIYCIACIQVMLLTVLYSNNFILYLASLFLHLLTFLPRVAEIMVKGHTRGRLECHMFSWNLHTKHKHNSLTHSLVVLFGKPTS